LVVGSQELLNLIDGECKFITVDRSLVLEGAIMPLARIRVGTLFLSILVAPKSEPEAGLEDAAKAELFRLKSKLSSNSSMAELGDAAVAVMPSAGVLKVGTSLLTRTTSEMPMVS
jgi:hypothetical protein